MSSSEGAHRRDSRSIPTSTPAPKQQQQQQQQAKRRYSVFCVFWAVVRALKYPAFALLVPAILNYAALNRENALLQPQDGVQYNIGWNQKIFLQCKGNGTPTVILDAPIGETSDVWQLVQPLVSKHTTVCTYDRAGLGYSDRPYENTTSYAGDSSPAARDRDRTTPYTVERMVDDLNRLLNYASNQPKPLILVSSDFSTVVSRFYTLLYEQDVVGLLLINPMAEKMFTTRAGVWPGYWYRHVVPQVHMVYMSGLLGFNRLGIMLGLIKPAELPRSEEPLPDEVTLRKKHFLCQPKHLSSVVDEYRNVATSMDQLRTLYSVKPFPEHIDITIATYNQPLPDLPPDLQDAWSEGVETLRQVIHPKARHISISAADHTVFYTKPHVIANAIVDMAMRLRRHLISPKA
eukprot:Em0005g1310a